MAVAKRKVSRMTSKKPSSKSTTKRKTTSSSKKSNMVKLVKKPTVGSISKPCNKSQLMSRMSDMTGQSRKEVQATMDALQQIIGAHMKKQGPGEFTLPGVCKMKLKHKPATKAKKGINPFTGEPTTFKAKPARSVVKIVPLKKLKEQVN